jgi:N-acetylglucosaminyldiphosphoundecaprenol N-acetyl-beta-D-mannosaminyltransferase
MERDGLKLGLYGATEAVLSKLRHRLLRDYPKLQLSYSYSPPFRMMTAEETEVVLADLRKAKVDVLLVGLGCPKQEVWMAENRILNGPVMVGVGAAFDFIAGSKRTAPRWVRLIYAEWAFRLVCEPRRLWKRYLKTNSEFVWGLTQRWFRRRFTARS